MRIYHAAYRQKNPTRKAGLRGAKKQVHADLMRVLEDTGKPGRRRRNPGAKSIDAFNLLGELNTFIAEEARKAGDTRATPKERKEARRKVRNFLALRDTVRARIEGYLDKGALDYSLQEAMREMTAAEIRIVRRMVDESSSATRFGPRPRESTEDFPMRAYVQAKRARAAAREVIKEDPEVQRLLKRVKKAGRVEEETRKLIAASVRRRRLSPIKWGRGLVQHGYFKGSEVAAREEIGDETYSPKDQALWDRVTAALKKKYPDGYIPPRTEDPQSLRWSGRSRKEEDLRLLIEMNHKDTDAKRRGDLRRRLEAIFKDRLQTKRILAYEAAGGRPLSQAEKKAKKRESSQKMQNLDEPYQVSPGMYGVVSKSNGKFKWALADYRGKIHFSGEAGTKNAASKSVGIALRILNALLEMDPDTIGWDGLPEPDRRWMSSNHPNISKKIARMLLRNMGKRVKVTKETATWILKSGETGQVEKPKKKGDEEMVIGEVRVHVGSLRRW
ncbi:MAG: hypothetical protein ACYTBS_09485 [Planctomycetota bacterium]|jgi:hypothetical protein